MGKLEDQTLINKIDSENMLSKIEEFPEQINAAWQQVRNFVIPTHYIKAKNIIILGMGGSAIGGDLIKDLAYDSSRISVNVIRDYTLPRYVNSDTLVIACSYSGNTEETLNTFTQAAELGAKCIAITSGNKIGSICRKYKIPVFEIKYESQPRAALAHLFIPLLGIFNKLGYIELDKNEIEESIDYLTSYKQKIENINPTVNNEAKKLAEKLQGKIPMILGSGILKSVARRFKDQINENSKQIALFDELPELCHNHIVGTDYPSEIIDKTYTIFFQSKFDHPRNNLRHQILMQLFDKKKMQAESIFINQKGSKLSEILHYVLFSDYVSYYLAIINEVNPTPVDVIGQLKDQLAQNK